MKIRRVKAAAVPVEAIDNLTAAYVATLQQGLLGVVVVQLLVMGGMLLVFWRVFGGASRSQEALAKAITAVGGPYKELSESTAANTRALNANTQQDKLSSDALVKSIQDLKDTSEKKANEQLLLLADLRRDIQAATGPIAKLSELQVALDEIRTGIRELVSGPISTSEHRSFVHDKLALIEAQLNVLKEEILTTKTEVLLAIAGITHPPNGTQPDAINITHLPQTNADGGTHDALKPTG